VLAKAKGVYKGRKPALNAERITQLPEPGQSGSKPNKAGEGVRDKPRNPLSIHPIKRKIVAIVVNN
jgi:hypothetical protein